jgi:hypothetical protein
MDPQITRAGFRIAFYVMMVSGVMLLFLRPGTAEFVVAVLSLLVGLLFAAAIGGLVFLETRAGRSRAAAHGVQQPLHAGDDGQHES